MPLLVAVGLVGCANLPDGIARPASQALAGSEGTMLGRIAAVSAPDLELTGLRLLPGGANALDARLALLRLAEQSVDLQYYLIEDDDTGRQLLRALRDAARRGVRVRLLVDDLFTASTEPLLQGLAAHDEVELRLFNPFPACRDHLLSRFICSAMDFGRVNRRMHNKLFVVDGVMAVTGGRNIADEYFMRHGQSNFVDLDVFIIGALLPKLQAMFDSYWNSPQAVPLQAIVPTTLSTQYLRRRFEEATGGAAEPEPPVAVDVLGYGPLADDLGAGRLGLVWAFATAYADPPERLKGRGASYGQLPLEDVESVRYSVRDMIRGARSEVVVSTPYLIPGERGMAMLTDLRQRGVSVKLLTNSLAATDEPLVHLGYRRYREAMLGLGVQLYELSPVRMQRSSRLGYFRSGIGRLHAKSAVVDRSRVFIGSMNFDPRSETHNTEMGVFIESAPLARELLRLMDLDRLQAAYRLRLVKPGGQLQWLANDDDGVVAFDSEPDVEWWYRLWLELLSPLAMEELL